MTLPTTRRLPRFWFALGAALTACRAASAPPQSVVPAVAPPDVQLTLFLIGDAGAPNPRGEPVLQQLQRSLTGASGERLAIVLGDNVYPLGIPPASDPTRVDAERRLAEQVHVLTATRTPGIIVPGNHDWAKSGQDGIERIRRQDTLVQQLGGDLVELLPHQGCPGPVVRDVGSVLRLVILDTQWWLHPGPRPEGDDPRCGHTDEATILARLDSALAGAGPRQVIVAAHHPLASSGEHGGHFGWRDHLFPLLQLNDKLWIPLPLIGSIYPIARMHGISDQDISGKRNVHMRAAIEAVLKRYHPLAWVDGHEHDLEVWRWTSARYLLVSGAGILGHEGGVSPGSSTQFASSDAGFMQLQFLRDGRIRLGVIAISNDGTMEETYATWLQ